MNVHPNEAFAMLLRDERKRLIAIVEPQLRRAVLLGEPVNDLRNRYRALLDVETSIAYPDANASTSNAISALVPQWPADFAPLPLWFTDPAAAAVADPPGPPCVVDLSAAPPTE